jgi:hypothetical protein
MSALSVTEVLYGIGIVGAKELSLKATTSGAQIRKG